MAGKQISLELALVLQSLASGWKLDASVLLCEEYLARGDGRGYRYMSKIICTQNNVENQWFFSTLAIFVSLHLQFQIVCLSFCNNGVTGG